MPCYLQSLSLKPGAPLRHAPLPAKSQRFSRPRSEAGQTRELGNAGWGPGAWGTFQGRPLGPGASLRNYAQLSLGAREDTFHQISLHHSGADWLQCTRSVVVCLPESWPGNRVRRKGLPAGAERGEQEGRQGGPFAKGLSRHRAPGGVVGLWVQAN